MSAFVTLFFISVLSSALLSLSVPIIFFIYLFFFISIIITKQFFYSKSFLFFAFMVFIFSFFCPYLIERSYSSSHFSIFFESALLNLSRAFMTSLLAILCFPILKKYFPILEGS